MNSIKSIAAFLSIIALTAATAGCAAFCDSNDTGCINKQHAIASQVATGSLVVLSAAAAVAATQPQPVYYQPVYVVPSCYWSWGRRYCY